MLLFESFVPTELLNQTNCIWCTTNQRKNNAHIFSRRIIKVNAPANQLRHSICAICNSNISKNIEDFLFKMTPLAYLADIILHNKLKSLKWIPNYYWNSSLKAWIIFIHDYKAKYETRPIQIMVNSNNQTLIYMSNELDMDSRRIAFLEKIKPDIIENKFTCHLSKLFPENFFPRGFYFDNQLILVGKSSEEIENLKAKILECTVDSEFSIKVKGNKNSIEKYQIKFQWNIKSYYDYCAKISFELYSLVAGREACLTSGFSELREIITNYKRIKSSEITLTEEETDKYFSSRFVAEGWLSYTEVNNNIAIFPMTDTLDDFNHTVYLYELQNGLVCATVKLFNLQFAQLILGQSPNPGKFRAWRIEYDLNKTQLKFFYAITDPIIAKQYQEVDETLKKMIITTNPNLMFTVKPNKGGL